MKNHMKLPTQLTPSTKAGWMQIVVWVLLAVFASLSVWAMNTGTTTPGMEYTPQDTTYQVGANSSGAEVPPLTNLTANEGKNDASKLLPASRWGGEFDLNVRAGILDVGKQFTTSIANLLFVFSGLVWSVLMGAVELGTGLDFVSAVPAQINAFSGSVYSSLGNAGVLVLVFVMGLITIGGFVLRGNGSRAVSLFLTMIIPLGIAQLVFTAAANSVNDNGEEVVSRDSIAYKMTPAGMAIEGNVIVTDIASNFATAFGRAGDVNGANALTSYNIENVYQNRKPNCDYYYARLYASYKAHEDVRNNSNTTPIMVTSMLWQRTYLESWSRAQFGNPDTGGLITCHQLEQNRGTTYAAQSRIASGNADGSLTGGGKVKDTGGTPYAGMRVAHDTDNGNYAPWHHPSDDWDREGKMLAWGACKLTSSGAGVVADDEGWSNKDGDDKLTNDNCINWAKGEGKDGIQHNDDEALEYKNMEELSERIGRGEPQFEVVSSYWGENGGSRMAEGFVALIVAVIYLWAIGLMAVGCAVASVGLAIFLSMLPVTLVLLAVPAGKSGSSAGRAAGMKLLRLTGSFLLAKAVFVLLLTLLINFIALLTNVVNADGIINGFIPLLAVVALNKLLKALGVGSLNSVGGALSMATAGAGKIVGDKGGAARMMSAKGLNKTPAEAGSSALNRADKMFGAASKFKRSVGNMGKKAKARSDAKAADPARKDLRRQKAANSIRSAAGALSDGMKKSQLGAFAAAGFGALKSGSQAAGLTGKVDPLTGEQTTLGLVGKGKRILGKAGSAIVGEERQHLNKVFDSWKADGNAIKAKQNQEMLQRGLRAQLAAQTGVPLDEQYQIKESVLGQLPQMLASHHGLKPGMVLDEPSLLANARRHQEALGLAPGLTITNPHTGFTFTAPAVHQLVQKAGDADSTFENAKSIVNWLPKEVKQRLKNETEVEYSARIVSTMIAKGGIDPSTGQLTNWLETMGIKDTAEDRQLILDLAAGKEVDDPRIRTVSISSDEHATISTMTAAMGSMYSSAMSANRDQNKEASLTRVVQQEQPVVERVTTMAAQENNNAAALASALINSKGQLGTAQQREEWVEEFSNKMRKSVEDAFATSLDAKTSLYASLITASASNEEQARRDLAAREPEVNKQNQENLNSIMAQLIRFQGTAPGLSELEFENSLNEFKNNLEQSMKTMNETLASTMRLNAEVIKERLDKQQLLDQKSAPVNVRGSSYAVGGSPKIKTTA